MRRGFAAIVGQICSAGELFKVLAGPLVELRPGPKVMSSARKMVGALPEPSTPGRRPHASCNVELRLPQGSETPTNKP
jgi:hypothetical protein